MVRFGATDGGEPCFDMSWTEKLKDVDGAVVISKGSSEAFRKALVANKQKVIFHATITGLGGSALEPGVPKWEESVENLEQLIEKEGFPAEQVVLRIDPIIGEKLFAQLRLCEKTEETWRQTYALRLAEIQGRVIELGVKRVRFSYLDVYPHVKERLLKAGLSAYEAAPTCEEMAEWNKTFAYAAEKLGVSYESCAEANVPGVFKIGCISKRDYELLGLDVKDCKGKCAQREQCLCCGNKVELLNGRAPCAHGCLYCFWKDRRC